MPATTEHSDFPVTRLSKQAHLITVTSVTVLLLPAQSFTLTLAEVRLVFARCGQDGGLSRGRGGSAARL